MRKWMYLVLTVVLILVVSPAYALFTNGGFESGNTTGWTIGGWNGGADHSVITSFTPQFNNTSGWISGIPYYGTYSLLLGSPGVGHETDNAHWTTASQTDSVTQADLDAGLHLYFKWGAILEEPTNNIPHTNAEQPYFSALLQKNTGSGWTEVYTADHRANETGFTSIGFNATGDAGEMWYGTGIADIDLAGLHVGDQVKIDLFVRDCGLGGHGGLVFLDGFGTEKPPDDNVIPEPGTLMLLGTGLVGMLAMRRKRS
ncbi:MAG: PEP-CTERM sorting domain-containing protein [bacterium]|nr:PEP-CTERM sorting domain-containing protein [bacterium]